jgi:hypothetical protein
MKDACDLEDKALSDSTVGLIAGDIGVAAIAAGIVPIVTEPPAQASTGAVKTKPSPLRWSVLPTIGPRESTVRFALTF